MAHRGGRKIRHKDSYSDPTEGTVIEGVVKMLLRDEGATSAELDLFTPNEHQAISSIPAIRDIYGYDVRTFYVSPENRGGRFKRHRHKRACTSRAIYKIIGRYTWEGGYISYVDPDKYAKDLPWMLSAE